MENKFSFIVAIITASMIIISLFNILVLVGFSFFNFGESISGFFGEIDYHGQIIYCISNMGCTLSYIGTILLSTFIVLYGFFSLIICILSFLPNKRKDWFVGVNILTIILLIIVMILNKGLIPRL